MTRKCLRMRIYTVWLAVILFAVLRFFGRNDVCIFTPCRQDHGVGKTNQHYCELYIKALPVLQKKEYVPPSIDWGTLLKFCRGFEG